MTSGADLPGAPQGRVDIHAGRLGLAEVALNRANRAVSAAGMVALLVASFVLTYSVFSRYLFHAATDWQDEVAVFCIVGAVFLAGAWVQSQRGHVGIEAVASILPARVNRYRIILVDLMTLAFCAFFAWKSWTLFHEAWVDKMTTSSTFAPPLTIPYGLMAIGMTLLVLQLVLQTVGHFVGRGGRETMSILALGLLFGGVTLVVMFSGMPIAFALGFVAIVFMAVFMPASSLDTVTQNVYEEMASITLLSIPLFILKGAAIGRSDAGRDLYLAMHAWMQRIPGGLGIANVFTCALFAAMAGSSPATCSAIGSAGIPEMRSRGYSPGFAAGIIAAGGTLGILLPPSITMILYAVAAEVSLGRLFLAGIGPGLLLVALFALYAAWKFRREYAAARAAFERDGTHSNYLVQKTYTFHEKSRCCRASFRSSFS